MSAQLGAAYWPWGDADLAVLGFLAAQEVQDAISAGELASFMEVMGISTDDIWTDLFHVSRCCE